ncbi:class 1 isoprenoid biosynthesis enzyme [Clostridium sp. MSJ-11]|uniref:Class 1 isoprenoid biosynthesis enzyme n=1 Tax=Clostridium mobile TaxID=2841512 RepID=A0ABS6EES0_9CLOT|nr:class 1 isoprenoid biosynthesis enzyme [Clostridium mobile]MBU5483707.1 class 1 isoprenoid biosynthesis enzyme [Clostridium mobile]
MLYPYTDNYLDDPSISMEEKRYFNERFSKRLKGEKIKSINCHEEMVYRLVEYIESVFNRDNYKEVYEKLLLIHDGQIKSLMQQEVLSIPYEKDILGISIEKGGASVLVDGYLVNGALTKDEEIFAYGYGFLLQLCDDLQDVSMDLKNNHMTIMSQLAGKYPLDMITNKLINLTINIIDTENCFKGSNKEELKELIKNNCIIMILFSIAHNKKFYSNEYIKTIENFLPFTLSYIDNLKSNLETKFNTLDPTYNNTSIEDILLYLLD